MPKIRTYEYGNRQPVVRMIEKVKDLRSEFEIRALRDSSNFRYRCVEVDESRAEKSISVQVAQRAEGLQRKGTRVEPKIVHISSSGRQAALPGEVRPFAGLAGWVVQICLIDSVLDAERSSATGGHDATHLPTFCPSVALKGQSIDCVRDEIVPHIEIADALIAGKVIWVRLSLLAAIPGLQSESDRAIVDALGIRIRGLKLQIPAQ